MNEVMIKALKESGHEFLEKPYSDTNPIKKRWVGRFDFEEEWGLEISLDFFNHSRNWSMGSVNIDAVFFSLTIGPFDMFFAYRIVVTPPKKTSDL